MAAVCVALGIRPKDYWEMTLPERDAIVERYNKVAKERKKT